jgi:hypothetical protein
MRKWSWVLAAAALSCGSPKRQFAMNAGGAPDDGPSAGDGGVMSGGGGTGVGEAGSVTAEGGEGGAEPAESGGEAGVGGTRPEETCGGCLVGTECVPDGAVNPDNPCQVCLPELATNDYSANAGAECGSRPTACSAQDVCSERGVCEVNHLDDGTPCRGGACEDGTCRTGPNPFDCIAPTPPEVEFTAQVYGLIGPPPPATGGTIPDGRYTPVRFELSDSEADGIDIRTFEFSKGYVQAASQYYSLDTMGAFIPAVRFVGSYSTTGGSLSFDFARCDPQYNIDIPTISYTVTPKGLITSWQLAGGGTLVTSYLRQSP